MCFRVVWCVSAKEGKCILKQKRFRCYFEDRVEGTAVFDRGGKNIGHVDHVLIEKRGGQATEAVLSVGGFLGMGDEKHCVPWSKLDYDTDLVGYHLNIDEDALSRRAALHFRGTTQGLRR